MPATNGSPASGSRTPDALIPRRRIFGNPDRASPQISPDGRRLGFLAPANGVLQVWVAPADDVAAARPVTQDAGRGIRVYGWTHSPRHLVYLQDDGGNENWHVHAVDVETGTTRDLTPYPDVQARIVRISSRRPGEIAVGLNDRDARWHDLWTIDLATGERTLVLRNDTWIDVDVDGDYRPAFGLAPQPSGTRRIDRFRTDGSAEPWCEVGPDDELTTAILHVTNDGRTAYMIDSRGRDTAALVEIDLATGARSVLAEDPRADADDVLRHPVTQRVQAVSFHRLRQEWRVLDPDVADDLAALSDVCRGDPVVTSRTLDDRTWAVTYILDDAAPRTYLWDRTTRTARFLFAHREALEGVPLARMHAFEVAARDGLSLPSYLSLPRWTDPDARGRPDAPLPMVLLVHGGPWARDSWCCHPEHQWLANRGYAVLSVNYRGSTGFGKAFVAAADREWAGKMHDDLVDAVRWAVAEGIADPARVAIAGGSYGGYAALVGLTFTPDLFACAVDVVGPSSIVTLIEAVPPYWKPLLDSMKRRVGDPDTPEGRADLLARSPLTHAAKIRRPLLIAQGANDPRVKKAEADQIVAALREHGIPVTYVLFPDEGHGFARPANNTAFRAIEETFLARWLGGRLEPESGEIAGSSAQFPGAA